MFSPLPPSSPCPPDLLPAVCTLIAAAKHCSDLPELKGIRQQLAGHLGQKLVKAAEQLRPETGVDGQVRVGGEGGGSGKRRDVSESLRVTMRFVLRGTAPGPGLVSSGQVTNTHACCLHAHVIQPSVHHVPLTSCDSVPLCFSARSCGCSCRREASAHQSREQSWRC